MGIYYSHRLKITGPEREISNFVNQCIKRGPDGVAINFDYERIPLAPIPLPAAYARNRLGRDIDVGFEALARRHVPVLPHERMHRSGSSVLETELARELGLTDYDKLAAWLKEHRPEALVAGEAGIRAQGEIDYLSSQGWPIDEWGVLDLDLLTPTEFQFLSQNADETILCFVTKGLALNPVAKSLCIMFPSLKFRLVLADVGHNVAMACTGVDGNYHEEYVDFTDDFISELEGAPYEVDDFYVVPSVARTRPMTHIRLWRSERRIHLALETYPVYEPPHAGFPPTLSEDQAEANFRHFLDTRETRLESLRAFLETFGVTLNRSDQGIKALDRWVARYGAFLTLRETGAAFLTHLPAWRGPWQGFNVLFDLGTFLGETIIERNADARWHLDTDAAPGLRNIDDHYRSIIVRMPELGWPIRVFDDIKIICDSIMEHSYMWKKPMIRFDPASIIKMPASHILAKPTEYSRFAENVQQM